MLTAAHSAVPEKLLLPQSRSHSNTSCWSGHWSYCEVFTALVVSCVVGGLLNVREHSRECDSALFILTTAEYHCYCNKIDFVNSTDAQILTAWNKTFWYLPVTQKHITFTLLCGPMENKSLSKFSWYVGRQCCIWIKPECASSELDMLLFHCQQANPLICLQAKIWKISCPSFQRL